ncbi:hypothetical protein PFISCL1PPCAC_7156, partial [Pristionchus fissidentatus]
TYNESLTSSPLRPSTLNYDHVPMPSPFLCADSLDPFLIETNHHQAMEQNDAEYVEVGFDGVPNYEECDGIPIEMVEVGENEIEDEEEEEFSDDQCSVESYGNEDDFNENEYEEKEDSESGDFIYDQYLSNSEKKEEEQLYEKME